MGISFEDVVNGAWVIVLALAVYFSLPHGAKMRIGTAMLDPYEWKPRGRKKSRAELEDDLHREYGAEPLNAEQAERFARNDREDRAADNFNHIINHAAHAQHHVWWDADDNKHWRETVVDMYGNEVTVHSSDGTGLLDGS